MKLPAPLHIRWITRSVRERRLLLAALALLVGAALWAFALAPALATLRSAEAQHRVQDGQLQAMQSLQAQAKQIQSLPPLPSGEARRLLGASVKALEPMVQMVLVGERATLTLKGASAEALAQCLAQARLNARARPSEAHLVRNTAGTWDGTLVLTLP